MDLTDQEKKVLKKGFLIKGFFEAFGKLLEAHRDIYAQRIRRGPKKTQDEHVMYLLMGNGGCLALNEFEKEIGVLHKQALDERPNPLDQA